MILGDPDATARFAADLGARLAARLGPGERVVLALTGELGAGKTTLVRGLAEGLGAGAGRWVSSPTFAIVQTYPTTPPLTHVDLYRLGDPRELQAIGGDELFAGPGIVAVEWADRFAWPWPEDTVELRLARSGDDVRECALVSAGARWRWVREAWAWT